MKIAVLSDTHMSAPEATFVHVFERYCRTADVVLHCGDMVSDSLWAYCNSHARFFAVRGNCDQGAVLGSLPVLRTLELDGLRLGMGHGWGPRSQVGEVVAARFSDVHIVCYGHTHIRDWRETASGVFLLNPGSCFHARDGQPGLALLTLARDAAPAVEWISL